MSPKPLPEIAIRLHTKRGKADCSIAALASYLGRDYEEVLIAASKINKAFWHNGLSGPQHVRVAQRLGFRTRWTKTYDIETDRGVLWMQYHDNADLEHSVVLIDGLIFDPEYVPATLIEQYDYCRILNGNPNALLMRID